MNPVWKQLHSNYQEQHWINKPSIFAKTAIKHFPESGKILELVSGHAQDSFYFAKKGYQVMSTDIETSSLESNLFKKYEKLKERITVLRIDLKESLPFDDQSFEIVYAHLSLHYFDKKTTWEIINEVSRVLKPGGVFAFLTNSVNDPEYQTGALLEEDFFLINKVTKRYFSIESTKEFTQNFNESLLDNDGATYKDQAKGISNLIRYIGNKP